LVLLQRIFYDARSHVTMHGHMSRCTVTCYVARSHVTMQVTFYDARSHVTMHGHMSRCTVTCYDAWSHERKVKTLKLIFSHNNSFQIYILV